MYYYDRITIIQALDRILALGDVYGVPAKALEDKYAREQMPIDVVADINHNYKAGYDMMTMVLRELLEAVSTKHCERKDCNSEDIFLSSLDGEISTMCLKHTEENCSVHNQILRERHDSFDRI